MNVLGLLAIVPALWSCTVQAAPPTPQVLAGQRTYQASCASCHAIGPSARSGFGPQLTGIVGRRAAADPDYPYSPAMARAQFDWTEERLAAFIRKPAQVVPGTKMRFFALGFHDEKMANLLAYLRSVEAAPGTLAAPKGR